MSSNYTVNVADNSIVSLRDFSTRCSTIFGYQYGQRDGADAVERESIAIGQQYLDSIKTAKDELQEILELSAEAVDARNEADYVARDASYRAAIHTIAVENTRYKAMLAKVEAMVVTTRIMERLKNFMVQQLEGSIESSESSVLHLPSRQTGEEWREWYCYQLRATIKYYESTYIKWVCQRDAWHVAKQAVDQAIAAMSD